MIVVSGAAGFIGSCMVSHLNQQGETDLILVDDFSRPEKENNYKDKHFLSLSDRSEVPLILRDKASQIKLFYHLGARTDTAETDVELFNRLNLNYSKAIWEFCADANIPLIYASSAATYGDGSLGFEDDHSLVAQLKPLNPYGDSKNDFDAWALQQQKQPPFWAGLKFFNVYGPNEYHKGRMASVILHAFRQIEQSRGMKLFRSHREGIANGEQSRDFIYVKDVVKVLEYLGKGESESGLYNLGTGEARSFLDLTRAVFKAMNIPENISFIDTPADIRETYQYFTEANMDKLRNNGYTEEFISLEKGVEDYVGKYLQHSLYY